uniref:inter-alpha-trypsin inhibitor heavy chain H3-like n=1 Tax=Styela clava TaxID=7725 RepID=UPI001939E797|nr:inter-alpha-trypsin inhibitor heavy chain H3-like [Styela clava]
MENDGLAKKIYEDSDADLQLEGFFQRSCHSTTSFVLLCRILVSNISDVSKVHCDQYFDGSEVLIVGAKLDDKPLHSKIIGHSLEGEVEYNIVSSGS